MSYSYDRARKRYVVRKTINGKRVYIGRYQTEEDALLAEKHYLRRLDRLSCYTLDAYKPQYIKTGDSIIRRAIKNVKLFQMISRAKATDEVIRRKIEKL